IMLKYVSFKPGDDTPQFVCPRCLKPFSAVSPPHNMPCGHIECDNCRKRRSQRNETDTPCCKQASSGYSNYFPSTNHPLSDLANQLNSSSRSFFDGKVMCEECDGRHAEDDLLSCANCKKSHVRYSCLMDRHNSHGWSKGGIHADYHNHHMTPDHTLLPDRRVLNVSGHNFIVSASVSMFKCDAIK
ncbi:hypothetical protein PENTCL1PPCAC_17602, partial [Pristionchus entomophagus]